MHRKQPIAVLAESLSRAVAAVAVLRVMGRRPTAKGFADGKRKVAVVLPNSVVIENRAGLMILVHTCVLTRSRSYCHRALDKASNRSSCGPRP